MNIKLKSKGDVKEQINKKPEIKIYTTSACPFCHKAKENFNKKKIAFKEINVGGDNEKAKEMIKISGQTGVPVIVIGKKVIVGFDKNAIDGAIAA